MLKYEGFFRFPGTELPDFYPIFVVLNSWSGFFIFCLLGVMSTPFRTSLFGGGSLRVRLALPQLKHLNKVINILKFISLGQSIVHVHANRKERRG